MTEEDISAKAKAIRELTKSIIDTIPEGFDSRDAMVAASIASVYMYQYMSAGRGTKDDFMGSMEKVWEAHK